MPKLLDIAHREIEKKNTLFALTGSSARKLKRGAANLLAGRAFLNHLFPLTFAEIGDQFDLDAVLQWGSLPGLFGFSDDDHRAMYLSQYVQTYLKEEVFAEQLVRGILPFRKFLNVAAQSNGQILNFSKIGSDIGVDSKTVQTYFDILEDTLLGFYLPATDASFRKQQVKAPKFYIFDVGVKRAIEGVQAYKITSGQELGREFEHWVVTEMFRLNSYQRDRYSMSYLHTKGGIEVDLVLKMPRGPEIFVEIKSTQNVTDRHLEHLQSLRRDHPKHRYICLCREKTSRIRNGIEILNWQDAFKELDLV